MGSGPVTVDEAWRARMVAIWLVVFSNGPLFFVARHLFDRPGTWEGPVLRPAIVLSLGSAVALVALDTERADGRRLCSIPAVPFVAAVAFGLWAALTTLWSLEPDITLWRGLGYAFLPFVAWVVADLGPRQWRWALALAGGFIVVTSLIAVAIWPQWATDINDDWRGVMTNRNGLGPICGLSLFAGVALVIDGRRRSGLVLVVASAVCLLGTGSRTAMLAFGVGFGLATVVVVGRRVFLETGLRRVVGVAGGLLTAGGVAVVGFVVVMWDEATFAQRRTIWDLLGDHIAKAPLHGNGWAAFWYHPELHTEPLLQRGSAHGAVPELLLGGGVMALLLWLLVTGYALVGVGRAAWRRPDCDAWLWLGVVVFLLVENLTESYVLWFSYNWILTIAAALRFGPHRDALLIASPEVSLARWLGSSPMPESMPDRPSEPSPEHSSEAPR